MMMGLNETDKQVVILTSAHLTTALLLPCAAGNEGKRNEQQRGEDEANGVTRPCHVTVHSSLRVLYSQHSSISHVRFGAC